MRDLYKYPRTYHVPWSEGCTSDDKRLKDMTSFEGKQVIVTEKMDGENTTIYKDYFHARSLDGNHHNSQSYVKGLANRVGWQLGELRVCGENMYAKHSIHYKDLKDYFLAFSVWDKETCLSWDKFEDIINNIQICRVPVLYQGVYDESKIRSINLDLTKSEGYVIRVANEFKISDFSKSVAKFVRTDHVKTNKHWKSQKIIKNELRD